MRDFQQIVAGMPENLWAAFLSKVVYSSLKLTVVFVAVRGFSHGYRDTQQKQNSQKNY